MPGLIRLDAPLSRELNSFCCSSVAGRGESWSSAIGGGLGKRGELDGDGTDIAGATGGREREAVSSARGEACLLSAVGSGYAASSLEFTRCGASVKRERRIHAHIIWRRPQPALAKSEA